MTAHRGYLSGAPFAFGAPGIARQPSHAVAGGKQVAGKDRVERAGKRCDASGHGKILLRFMAQTCRARRQPATDVIRQNP